MRLMLVWAMAAKLPTAIDSTERISNMFCQSFETTSRPLTSTRMTMTKAASFGALAMISVTAVGAP